MSDTLNPLEHFLPPIPSRARIKYNVRNTIDRSATGIVFRNLPGIGFWEGSFKLAPQRPEERLSDEEKLPEEEGGVPNQTEVISFLHNVEMNGFFFADILTDTRKAQTGLVRRPPIPDWRTITNPIIDETSIDLGDLAVGVGSIDVEAGDIISLRQVGYEDFVTARIVTRALGSKIEFKHPLPDSYTLSGAKNQICTNRPHVRAIFSSDASAWSMGHGYIDIPAISWVEDSIAIGRASSAGSEPIPTYVIGFRDGGVDYALKITEGADTFYLSAD